MFIVHCIKVCYIILHYNMLFHVIILYIHMYVCILYVCVYIYICIYVYVYIYIYIYIYVAAPPGCKASFRGVVFGERVSDPEGDPATLKHGWCKHGSSIIHCMLRVLCKNHVYSNHVFTCSGRASSADGLCLRAARSLIM